MTDDNFFGNDAFEEIIRNFFGQNIPRRAREERSNIYNPDSENEERIIDFIESKDKVFLVFEFPGYDEKDLDLKISGVRISIKVKKRSECPMQEYLSQKLCAGETISETLPEVANAKLHKYTFKNGILEVEFEKKWQKKV